MVTLVLFAGTHKHFRDIRVPRLARPRQGQEPNPKLILLLIATPLAMAIVFTVAFAADSNPGELMMALLGWGFTVWMCVKASGSLKGKTQIGVRTASIPTEDRQAPARPRPWLLLAALLFGLTASAIGSA